MDKIITPYHNIKISELGKFLIFSNDLKLFFIYPNSLKIFLENGGHEENYQDFISKYINNNLELFEYTIAEKIIRILCFNPKFNSTKFGTIINLMYDSGFSIPALNLAFTIEYSIKMLNRKNKKNKSQTIKIN